MESQRGTDQIVLDEHGGCCAGNARVIVAFGCRGGRRGRLLLRVRVSRWRALLLLRGLSVGFVLHFLVLLVLFVFKLAVVGDAADRWDCLRRDLNEVESLLFGDEDRCCRGHGTEVFTRFGDHDNFRDENLLVHTIALFDDNFRFGAMVPSSSHESDQ